MSTTLSARLCASHLPVPLTRFLDSSDPDTQSDTLTADDIDATADELARLDAEAEAAYEAEMESRHADEDAEYDECQAFYLSAVTSAEDTRLS